MYLNDEHIGDDFLPLGKLVRQADRRIQIWANRIEDLETTKKAEPYIDVIVPYSPWLSPKGLGFGRNGEAEEFLLETGKPWWAYRHAFWTSPERAAIPRANPKSPHDMLRSRPWLAWKLGLDGYGFWVFTAPRWWGRYDGFPDVAPKGPYTNVGFIYMGHDGPVTSRRLEAYRDGWEDYKLLWIVREAAQIEGQDPQLAGQALDEIGSTVEQVLAGASQDELRHDEAEAHRARRSTGGRRTSERHDHRRGNNAPQRRGSTLSVATRAGLDLGQPRPQSPPIHRHIAPRHTPRV